MEQTRVPRGCFTKILYFPENRNLSITPFLGNGVTPMRRVYASPNKHNKTMTTKLEKIQKEMDDLKDLNKVCFVN